MLDEHLLSIGRRNAEGTEVVGCGRAVPAPRHHHGDQSLDSRARPGSRFIHLPNLAESE